jgi:hypothetical protein
VFRGREEIRRRINEVAEKFRQKGATSPEKAMTTQELGLPPRFEQAMHRRLGQTGIFVEVNGKYYLNETRLKEIQEQRAKGAQGGGGGGGSSRAGPPGWSRILGLVLMLPLGIIVALALSYFVVRGSGYYPGEFFIILLVVALGLFLVRVLFWRSRRRYYRGQYGIAEQSETLLKR